jgi:hypothetical protein
MTAWTSSAAFVSKGKPDDVVASTFKQDGFAPTSIKMVWTPVNANGDKAGLKYNVEYTMKKESDETKTVWKAVTGGKDMVCDSKDQCSVTQADLVQAEIADPKDATGKTKIKTTTSVFFRIWTKNSVGPAAGKFSYVEPASTAKLATAPAAPTDVVQKKGKDDWSKTTINLTLKAPAAIDATADPIVGLEVFKSADNKETTYVSAGAMLAKDATTAAITVTSGTWWIKIRAKTQ